MCKMIGLPEGEYNRKDEDPSHRKPLPKLVVRARVVFREDHDEDHVDHERARSVSKWFPASNFVYECQANCVGNYSSHPSAIAILDR
jgi:hypothetical protein